MEETTLKKPFNDEERLFIDAYNQYRNDEFLVKNEAVYDFIEALLTVVHDESNLTKKDISTDFGKSHSYVHYAITQRPTTERAMDIAGEIYQFIMSYYKTPRIILEYKAFSELRQLQLPKRFDIPLTFKSKPTKNTVIVKETLPTKPTKQKTKQYHVSNTDNHRVVQTEIPGKVLFFLKHLTKALDLPIQIDEIEALDFDWE